MQWRDTVTAKAFRLLTPYWKWVLVGQAAMLLSVLLTMVFPWVVKDIFDTIIQQEELRELGWLIAGLTAVFALLAVVSYVRTYALSYVGENMIRDLRVQLYSKLQQLSLGFFEQHTAGEIVSRMTNDIGLLQIALTGGLTSLIQQIIALFVGLGLLLYLDWQLTLITLLVVPAVAWLGKTLGKRIKLLSRQVQEQLGHITSFLNQTLAGVPQIKGFRLEDYVIQRFSGEADHVLSLSLWSVRVRAKLNSVIGMLNDFVIVIVMGFGGYRVITGALTAGELIAFILYVQTLTGPIRTLTGVYAEIQRAVGAAERVLEYLEVHPQIQDPADPVPLPVVRGDIAFENVCFAYQGDETVLQDISFRMQPGETVALVGPSGAGKSTIAKLVPRFYDVTGGTIRVDGTDIRDVTISDLRQHIGIVSQDPFLFGVSIRDNIAAGRISASDAEIQAAAQAAHAHDFIEALPEGYDTQVGERGVRLSGGQRQRISIARAILKDPAVLILDEATSSLDTVSEAAVQEALRVLAQKRTTLVIAHRLSTVINADHIVVLEAGRIIQEGTHAELLQEAGLYADLFRRARAADEPAAG